MFERCYKENKQGGRAAGPGHQVLWGRSPECCHVLWVSCDCTASTFASRRVSEPAPQTASVLESISRNPSPSTGKRQCLHGLGAFQSPVLFPMVPTRARGAAGQHPAGFSIVLEGVCV